MELFMQGFALGSGLILAFMVCKGLIGGARARRRENFQAAVSAEVARRMQQLEDPWSFPVGSNDRKFVPIQHP